MLQPVGAGLVTGNQWYQSFCTSVIGSPQQLTVPHPWTLVPLRSLSYLISDLSWSGESIPAFHKITRPFPQWLLKKFSGTLGVPQSTVWKLLISGEVIASA